MSSDQWQGGAGIAGQASRKTSTSPPPMPLLRPMEIGELLDEAFDLYKRDFRLLFGIAVLLNVPVGVLIVAVPDRGGGSLVVNLLNTVVALITTCALTYAALERLLGRPTTITAAYRHAMSRFLRLFSGTIVYGLAVFAGLLLFIVPGVLVLLWSLLLAPVVVIENRGGVRALERARQLAAGNMWRLFVLGLALLVVLLIFGFALVALAGLLAGVTGTDAAATPEPSNTAALLLQAVVVMAIVLFQSAWTPVLAAAELLTYIDLRIRREAWDLELLTTAVEARAGAARGMSGAPPTPGPVGS